MLLEKVREDVATARHAKDTKTLPVLVTLLSDLLMLQKDKRRDITEDEAIAVVRKYLAGIDQTLELTRNVPERQHNHEQALFEWELLNKYMPIQLTDAKLRDVIREFAVTLTTKSPKDVGKVMAHLKEHYSGKYDGALASRYAKEILSET